MKITAKTEKTKGSKGPNRIVTLTESVMKITAKTEKTKGSKGPGIVV